MSGHATPRVSIIMPAYNVASVLEESVQSVLAQTFADWELLIVDDGSTDETLDVAASLACGESRIKIMPLGENSGLPAQVRNRGLEAARGEYFAFLDADDLWLPEKLELQLHILESEPDADAICCLYEVFGDEDRAALANRMLNHVMVSPVQREEMLRYCAFQTSTVVFRRRVYEFLGGMNEDPLLRSVEDYEYFTRMVLRFRVERLPEKLVRYRIQPLGASLSTETLYEGNARGWALYRALKRAGVYTAREARAFRAALYYEDAKDRLFHLRTPYRRPLLHAVIEGSAPVEAFGMLALCWLPSGVLRALLTRLLYLRNLIRRLRVRGASSERVNA